MRRRLADRKRHACHERVKDDVLEEMSPKSSILPEEPEKPAIPNPASRDRGTVRRRAAHACTADGGTGARTSRRGPLSPTEKRAVIAMQAHLRCEDLLPAQGELRPHGSRGRSRACRSTSGCT